MGIPYFIAVRTMTRLGNRLGKQQRKKHRHLVRWSNTVFLYLNPFQVAFLVHGNAPEREGRSVRPTHRIASLHFTSKRSIKFSSLFQERDLCRF